MTQNIQIAGGREIVLPFSKAIEISLRSLKIRFGRSLITTSGIVSFTTFAPEATSSGDPCGASLGLGTAYNFDILSANAALDWNGDGVVDIDDRAFELSGGIPSSVVPVFTSDGVYGVVGVEGGSKQLGKLADIDLSRTHWLERTDF